MSAEAQTQGSTGRPGALGAGSVASGALTGAAKDNSEKYKAMAGIEPADLQQLLRLDKDLQRMFELASKKRNKNDEIVRNKLAELNKKTTLREYLFKEVSYEAIKRDTEDLEKEVMRLQGF